MGVDKAGVEFIKEHEDFSSTPYKCQGGKWTIGWGHTDGVTQNTPPINKMQGEQFLNFDLEIVEDVIERLIEVPLTQNEYNALASLVFNTGESKFKKSKLLKKLNEGNKAGAAKEFLDWYHYTDEKTGKKCVSAGLKRRREDEYRMFLLDFNSTRDDT